jgi:soluble lytic murein transglycosylase
MIAMEHFTVTIPMRRVLLWIVLVPLITACQLMGSSDNTSPTKPVPTYEAVPTILPAPDLLERGLEYRAVQDDEVAAQHFLALLDHHPDVPEARRAQYYLAESFARRGHWKSAIESFESFLATTEQDSLTPPAIFWLARSYEEDGQRAQAIATYQQYRDFHTVLEPYAIIRQAALHELLGEPVEAAHGYEAVAASDIVAQQRAVGFEKAIALYQNIGQPETALQLYHDLLAMAELPGYRARILSEGAALAQQMGQEEQARTWQREIVTTAPATPQAVAAVDHLLNVQDSSLASYDAALVYFYAERYSDAAPLFDAALQQARAAPPDGPEEEEHVLEVQRVRAMNLRGTGDFQSALAELEQVYTANPDSEPGRQARLDWIQTLGQSGLVTEAARRYQEYPDTYPDDPRAPVAMDRAAQLLDRLGDNEAAFFVRMDLEQRYPDNDLSPYALHNAGVSLFLTGKFGEAGNVWQHIANNREGYLHALGAFWAARSAQHTNPDQAHPWFEAAVAAAPDTYYGTRAAEELHIAPAPTLVMGAPVTEDDWRALETWVVDWTDEPLTEVTEQGYTPEVAASGFVQRAVLLNQVGLQSEAIAEWNGAREAWDENPTSLMMLARIAHERDEPYIALKAAEQLAALAPPDAPPPPDVVQRLRFPLPYANIVLEESRTWGIDPRLLYALMRQESLFNPGATSWVGARGLAQVMPTTGEGIAAQLGINDFHTDDLYHPHVSVRFGAYYIAQQIENMQGSIVGGLAAYNGGLGNAQRWANGAHVADADLFTESIDFYETRNYVKSVYGYYGAYKRLYALP